MGDEALPVSELTFAVQRKVPRFKFIAEAEVTSVRNGMRVVARVSELSAQGCYVDTPEAFPVGSAIRLRINYGGSTCEFGGRIIYTHIGWGMGALFEEMGQAQAAVLNAWLAELARKTARRSERQSSLC
jgi:hypothetical protein